MSRQTHKKTLPCKTIAPSYSPKDLVGSFGNTASFMEPILGFTKLDENILQSSIMAEDDSVFKVWIALLAACKENGVAPISAMYLSSICRKDIAIVAQALEKLSSEDPYSRSTNDNGKRIERVDGGYKIINYQKYRSFTYSSSKDAVKKRAQRGHQGDMSPSGGDISASASASFSASYSSEFLEFWSKYPRKVGKIIAFEAYKKALTKTDFCSILDGCLKFAQWCLLKKVSETYIKHPSVWLNAGCWDDELDMTVKESKWGTNIWGSQDRENL